MPTVLEQPEIIPLETITPRWTPLRPHMVQNRLWTSKARFKVVPAGRRSGKTELAKRYGVLRAASETVWPDAWYVYAAPTLPQARRIYWRDLKALVPQFLRDGKPRESEMTIRLINGAEITVMGMDEPARIEGRPVNGVFLDEYGNMHERVWGEHVRPALSDRGGFAWMLGVPEGRNHYYRMSLRAQEDTTGEWENFHWKSADILPAHEIESARRDMDELTFRQEYEADFLTFEGRAYYTYDRTIHSSPDWHFEYNPNLPLILCFDFNSAPGVAVICQEQMYDKKWSKPRLPQGITLAEDGITVVLGEVWIQRDSNTELVAKRVLRDWGHHKGRVYLYGDATGGAKGSAKVKGSDWVIINSILKPHFGAQLISEVPKSNPMERVRLNAANSRLRSASGIIRAIVSPYGAPHLCMDLEGVALKGDGSGEIEKEPGSELTHISDAWGYYIVKKWPIGGTASVITPLL